MAQPGPDTLPGIWETLARFVSLRDANVRWVLAGSALLGSASGALGAFALLRRRALLGDALAHAALPGVCLAYLVVGGKDPLALLLGAAITASLGTLAVGAITRYSRVKPDAALALVLSVFFGVGIALLTWIQRHPHGDASGLDRFIFGQAAALVPADLRLMSVLTIALCAITVALFKEFKLTSFDPAYGAALGYPVRLLEGLLAALIVLAVVVGLQAVGVVLMAAMLVIPPAAARQWTDRLAVMVALSAGFGTLAAVCGTLASFFAPQLPTGPLIVLAAAAIFAVSLAFAPRRGLVATALERARRRRRIRDENVLTTLYQLEERRTAAGREVRPRHGSRLEEIAAVRALGPRALRRSLARLLRGGAVEHLPGPPERWRLTARGLDRARTLVRSHRLWETYLVERAQLRSDHVHRDAEEAEHVFDAELLAELEHRLGPRREDVHGSPIPPAGSETQEQP